MSKPTVLVLGTCDTKLQELLFLKDQIQTHSPARAILLDVGREDVRHEKIDIPRAELMTRASERVDVDVFSLPRGEVIKFMAHCAGRVVKQLYQKGQIHAIVSAGGSGGTSLAAEVMRNELPIGFPKVQSPSRFLDNLWIPPGESILTGYLLKMIVSTVASGDTGPM